ncbi:MAG: DUF2625 domain-containing protein [Myxococcaceae bacterium]|nr:DUF2625 domain-containing protein [Myxococcaceae bacterium]MCI0672428.1 DUF2625 domain-containing protein [Myxococcaceae bacterium]
MLEWARSARNRVEILPVDRQAGEATLVALQVTTRSPMGAVALESGGLLVDHGWLRILGSGHVRLSDDLATWNGLRGEGVRPVTAPGALVVAYDVLGGFFAINGGALPGPVPHVFYLAPDTLKWEDLGRGYSDFLRFAFDADLARFYEGQRWPGWEMDVATLNGGQLFSFYPPLFTKEGAVGTSARKPVPARESWGVALELARQV